jgi:prolyl-tRNA synthetase
MDDPDQSATAQKIYDDLNQAGIDVLMDDRDERPGVKFNDADLIGCPVRLTIGQKSLKEGKIEMKARSGGEVQLVALDQVVKAVKNLLEQLN